MESFKNTFENSLLGADCNEKLFWKLLKGQKSFSKMSAFLVNGNLLTDRNVIRDMWADHFEALGTPTENEYFDNALSQSHCFWCS